MAEDQKIKESEVKVPLRGPEAAKATMERLQKKGILPVKEEEPTAQPQPTPPAEEEYFPIKKAFPQEPEEQAKIVESYRQPDTEETIPPEIKRELTEKTRKLNTMAMGTSEGPGETKEVPNISPFTDKPTGQGLPGTEIPTPPPPTEHLEAKGGAAPLKRILKAQEEIEKAGSETAPVRVRIPEEAKAYIPPSQRLYDRRQYNVPPPLPEERLRHEAQKTPPEAPKQSFLARFWKTLTGNG